MAGCGTCPDQCGCVIANQCGAQYPGEGTADAPILIPERYDYPWVGESSDGSITITPADVRDPQDCSEPDGHAPDLVVNFCNLVNEGDIDEGDLLALPDPLDENCRPHRLRDPLDGEIMGRTANGKAGWVGGVVAFGGEVPWGVPLEFWGSEASVPDGWALCDGHLEPQVDNPNLFGTIVFNASGGVEPAPGMFAVPDKRGVVSAGRDNMGGAAANRLTDPNADVLGAIIGVEAEALAIGNLPAHTHPLAINASATGVTVNAAPSAVSIAPSGTGISVAGAGTGVSVVSGGAHNHDGAGANHDFLVENTAPAAFVYVDVTAINVDTANTMRFTSNGLEGGNSYKPNREPLANGNLSAHGHSISDPGHAHGISDPGHSHAVTNSNHGHGITDPQHTHTGTANTNPAMVATPVSKVQPTQAVNYIIRLG